LYAFGLLAMPPSIVTIELLPLIYPGEDETPEALAIRVQLAIANALKVKAVSRSSSEIFAALKAAAAKQTPHCAAGETETETKPKST
jgi:hypothetical protein